MSVTLLERAGLLKSSIIFSHNIIVQSPLIKKNCWEFLECGREPGGEKSLKSGICPASIDTSSDGLNGGKNGGRICWAISGTFCAKKIQGHFAKRQLSCRSCSFFKKVKEEEGIEHFHLHKCKIQNNTVHRQDIEAGIDAQECF